MKTAFWKPTKRAKLVTKLVMYGDVIDNYTIKADHTNDIVRILQPIYAIGRKKRSKNSRDT